MRYILTKCDKCKRVFRADNPADEGAIHHFEVRFGYGSMYDGREISFDLCDECLMEIYEGELDDTSDTPEIKIRL